MDSISKMTPWLVAIFCLVTAGCTNVTDQQTSETSHDQQVAILKQIRKVNEDGSYTFGYEADDGSFKVESRDVLGNIKGTFGFVDAEGEIKRVSYSSSNGTGFKATTVAPLQEQVSMVQSIPKVNRSSTTRRPPSIVYATESVPRSSVVQAIPRPRKTTTTTSTTTTTEPTTKSSYIGHFLKPTVSSSTIRSRPRFVVNAQRPAAVVEEEEEEEAEVEDESSQITRPVTEIKETTPYRRIVFAKRPIDSDRTLAIGQEPEERSEEERITTGNSLRRQLSEATTKSRAEDTDEHADVYGGALSTSRPLFTTTTPPRVVQRIPTLTERPKPVYVNQNTLGPAKFESPKFEESKDPQEARNAQQQRILYRGGQRPGRLPQPDRDYTRESSEPVYVRQRAEQQYLREVPPEGIIVEAQPPPDGEDGETIFRAVPLSRILFRPLPDLEQNQPQRAYADPEAPGARYLPKPDDAHRFAQNYSPPRHRVRPLPLPKGLPYPEDVPQADSMLRHLTRHEAEEPSEYSYTPSVPSPPPAEASLPISPPLSRRDFQILLRRLLVSQYGSQALDYPRTYLEDALYDRGPYPTYRNDYQTPVPRNLPRPNYDPAALPVEYGDRLRADSRRVQYSRSLNPLYNRPEEYQDPGYGKRVYRQKFYTPESDIDREEVLPPPIREALLLRMLQLAINSDRAPLPIPEMTNPITQQASYRYRKMGPVRNVQILGDETDDDDKNLSDKM